MRIEMVEIISLLNQSPLFGNLDAVRTQRLAALFSTRLFQPGEVIFSVGDPSETLYLICEGQVDLVADRKRAQEPFCTLHRGDFFGEEALLLDDPRFYQAVAQGDAILLALPVNRYLAIHQDLPEFEDSWRRWLPAGGYRSNCRRTGWPRMSMCR